MQYKVLVIENQVTQYRMIAGELACEEFEIYPKKDNYDDMIDLVRIILNKRYLERRTKATELFLEYLEPIKPDLFLIDHILVGCHDGDNGIHLAKKLREKGYTQPVLFFSRTQQSDIRVCKDIADLTGTFDWMPKGYARMGMTEANYFSDMVFPRIRKLLSTNDKDRYLPILKMVKSMLSNEEQNERFNPRHEELEKKFALSAEEKTVLIEFDNTKDIQKCELIDRLLDVLCTQIPDKIT